MCNRTYVFVALVTQFTAFLFYTEVIESDTQFVDAIQIMYSRQALLESIFCFDELIYIILKFIAELGTTNDRSNGEDY